MSFIRFTVILTLHICEKRYKMPRKSFSEIGCSLLCDIIFRQNAQATKTLINIVFSLLRCSISSFPLFASKTPKAVFFSCFFAAIMI